MTYAAACAERLGGDTLAANRRTAWYVVESGNGLTAERFLRDLTEPRCNGLPYMANLVPPSVMAEITGAPATAPGQADARLPFRLGKRTGSAATEGNARQRRRERRAVLRRCRDVRTWKWEVAGRRFTHAELVAFVRLVAAREQLPAPGSS